MKVAALVTFGLMLMGPMFAQNTPVPFVSQPLIPTAVAPGGPGFTLTVNGTGFSPKSAVRWNGKRLATNFVSSSQLTAMVAASDIQTAETVPVAVSTGDLLSNTAFLQVVQRTPSVGLTTANLLSGGSGTESVAVGDFNGDGRLDVAVTDSNFPNTGSVSILLGNGDGTFAPPVAYLANGTNASGIVAADLNADGKADLVVCDTFANTVSVLLGNGDGTFQPAADHDTGMAPLRVVAADFNNDGRLDLAVTSDYGLGAVSILLGTGTGTFGSYQNFLLDTGAIALADADFDNDGNLDLAVVGLRSISVLLGNGDGSFQSAVQFDTGDGAESIVAADLNGDGNLDLATANNTDGTISILLGNGDGTFRGHKDLPVGAGAISIMTGDFNGDGKIDLATSNQFGSSVSLLLANGSGTFAPHVDYPTDSDPVFIAGGDFNSDGRLDIATANVNFSTVSILMQTLVTLVPTIVTFDPQLLGTVSVPERVRLTNISRVSVSLKSVVASGDFLENDNCPSTIAPRGTCLIDVSFRPTASGTRTGMLTVTDSAMVSPQLVSLMGTGTFFDFSTDGLDFGDQRVGTSSQPLTVMLTNTAPITKTIVGIYIDGSDYQDFGQQNNCPRDLTPGSSCTFSLIFKPLTTGSRSASLNVVGGGGTEIVSLSGRGI